MVFTIWIKSSTSTFFSNYRTWACSTTFITIASQLFCSSSMVFTIWIKSSTSTFFSDYRTWACSTTFITIASQLFCSSVMCFLKDVSFILKFFRTIFWASSSYFFLSLFDCCNISYTTFIYKLSSS